MSTKECMRKGKVPTSRECSAILKWYGTSESVVAHSMVVAEVARIFAVYLNLMGGEIDTNLVLAAGRLHDMARSMPHHAEAGAAFLNWLGYPEVASVVVSHMDIQESEAEIGERELIYLADKCVDGERLIPLADRFRNAMEKYAGEKKVRDAIEKRWQHAEKIKSRLESIIGRSIESLLLSHERSIHTTFAQADKTIYLVRHGAIDANAGGKHFIGQLDLPLNQEGIRQATVLRERLEGVALRAVYCSDLQRSIATARIIAEPHGLKLQSLSSLREIALGEWEGMSFAELKTNWPKAYEERGRNIINFRPPGGESFLECMHRVIPTWHDILQAAPVGNVLVVGHKGVNRIILCTALGWSANRLLEISQDYGCLNVIDVSDNKPWRTVTPFETSRGSGF